MKKGKSKELIQSKDEISNQSRLDFLAGAFFIMITSFFPLYITRARYLSITKEKADMFILLTIIAVVLIAIVLLALFLSTRKFRLLNYYSQNEPKRPVSIAEWALMVFLLLTLASAIFSPWQDFVWRGFTQNGEQGRWEGFWAFFAYCLTFFIIARFYRPRYLHFVIFACGSILLSLLAVLEYLGFDILHTSGFFTADGTTDFPPLTRTFRTTLGNLNIVSAYCSMVIVLFAALFAGENKTKYSAFYIAASTMAFAVLLITRGDGGRVGVLGAMVLLIPYWLSNRERLGRILLVLAGWCFVHVINQLYLAFLKRGPVINQPPFPGDHAFLNAFTPFYPVPILIFGFVLLAAGLCLLLLLKKLKWPERLMKIAGLAVLAAVIIGSVLFIEIAGARRANQPYNIVWQAREMLRGRLGDTFGSYRGWVWKNGFSVIRNNPWLGTGPDTFFFALGGVQPTRLSDFRTNPQLPLLGLGGLQNESMAAYNLWWDKAHNTFLQIAVCMGLPALLAYLIFLGALFLPASKKAFSRPILLAFAAGSLSYLIQCIFQIDTPIDRPLLYIALGVMAVELWREKVEA
jgi:hypothetical protein